MGLFAQLWVAVPAPRTPHSYLRRISGTGIPPRSVRFHFRRRAWEASPSIQAPGLTLHPASAVCLADGSMMQPALGCARSPALRACRKAAPHAFESTCSCSPPACTLLRGLLEAGLAEQEALCHLRVLTASLRRASTVTRRVVFFLATPPADQQALCCVRILDTDNLLTSVGCGVFLFARLPPSPQNPSTKPSSLLAVAVRFSWLLPVLSCFAESFNAALFVLRLCKVASLAQTVRWGSCLCRPWDLLQAVYFPKEVSFQDSIWFL